MIRSTLWLAPLCMVVAAVWWLGNWGGDGERDAPDIDRLPNVVIIVVDTLRADHLGCYGRARDTSPHIDRLADEGVLFGRALSNASWTFPAIASLYTGLLPSVHGCTGGTQNLPTSVTTLPEHLKQLGYYCGGVISNGTLSTRFGFGRGFDVYDDYTATTFADLNLLALDTEEHEANQATAVTGGLVTNEAIKIIDAAAASGKPAFLYTLYFDPHDSYVPPPPFDTKFTEADYAGPMNGRGMVAMRNEPPAGADLDHLMALYDGEIAFTDAQIGRLLAKVDATFGPAETIVILTSDHGEAFGEHGKLLHGNSAYMEEVHVPMIWRWRGRLEEGRRVRQAVSLIDIAPTLHALLSFESPGPFQGDSIWPALRGTDEAGDRWVISEQAHPLMLDGEHVAVTTGDRRIHLRFFDAPFGEGTSQAAFDMQSSAAEAEPSGPLASVIESQFAGRFTQMWAQCLDLRDQLRSEGPGNEITVDAQVLERLKAGGYLAGD